MKPIILIHPIDTTTRFLEPITILLKELLGENLILLEPSLNGELTNDILSEGIEAFDKAETVIFMGHGTRTALHGGTDDENETHELFNFKNASMIFENKNLICLSCWSFYFIYGLEGLKSSIGFGNLPTTWKDITDARSLSKNAYKNYTKESINIYQNELVKAFGSGLKYSLNPEISLKNVFNYIKLFINKAISNLVKQDLDHQLAARQLYILKLDMKLKE